MFEGMTELQAREKMMELVGEYYENYHNNKEEYKRLE